MAHVTLEPDQLSYGDVVVNVDAMRVAIVKNYSPQHVHLKFMVRIYLASATISLFLLQFEYSQISCIWSPLQSHIDIILPPQGYTNLPLLFRDSKLGVFEK